MIDLKTTEEIEIMAEGGKKLRIVVDNLLKIIREGMTTKEIDNQAEALIIKQGGQSSFKRVKNYFWTTCLPINEQVVHTPPSERKLKKDDLLTLDIGVYYKGYHTDFATSFVVGGNGDPETKRFLDAGRTALSKAIGKAKAGRRLGEISEAIEKEIYGQGYFIMKDLTGHGIGKELHQDPYVFGFRERPVEKTIVLKPGLTIAIEVIYSKGSEEISYEEGSDWSITSSDKSLTACFEHTVAIMKDKTVILT